MQPRNPLVDTYRSVIGEVRGTVDAVLPQMSYLIEDNPHPLKQFRTTWKPAEKLLGEIDDELSRLGEGIFSITTDNELKDSAKSARITSLVAEARTSITAKKGQVLERAHAILDGMRKLAYPARPTPVDATQEAALAGAKADVRMVLDSITDVGRLCDEMKQQLSRAIADGDALAVWLLASSRWPEDYLRSRGAEAQISAWASEVAEVLDVAAPASLAEMRRAYRRISDPQHGLPVLDLLLNSTVSNVITTVAEWRPTAYSSIPPTRV